MLTVRALRLLIGASSRRFALYIALILIVSLLPVLQAWLMKQVVDRLAAPGAAAALDPATLMLAALVLLAMVVPAALLPIQEILFALLENDAVAAIDRRLMQAGAQLADLVRIEQPGFQDELRMLQDEAWRLSRLIAVIQNLLSALLTIIGLLLLLAGLNPLLPLLLLATGVPSLLVERRINQLKYQAMVKLSRPAREMDYCVRVTSDPATAKEIRVFGLGDFFVQRFRERANVAFAEVTQLRYRQLGWSALFGGLHAMMLGGGFWYVAAQAGTGRLTLGDVALYLVAIAQTESRTIFLITSASLWHGIWMYLRTLFAFFDSAGPAVALPPPNQGLPTPAPFQSGLELQQVDFYYPTSDTPVLNDLNAQLPAGRVTALVGANGAGKSTLVKLLTRMYDPTSGAILLDGAPLPTYDLAGLRGQISADYQDFARFALTLRENIAVGAFGKDQGALTVEEAAHWSGADRVAAKLAQGYETMLTRTYEDGVDLSGGEWQAVALARCFVRDAGLVIFDEPTAALDAEAEEQLFQHFRELTQGKTALLISHRFSTVRMADHILVIEGGRIVESGSHAELMAQGRRYAALFEMQAGWYV
ncbi:MAG: ABC transporter ATP-binding protein [Roseiflexaceae bacterium]